ncbi:MAG: hypothetical protein N2049_02335 [Anaerolineales bacterium]|nr:hypothetical protein [Anaerolineales bacterium]MDW8226467.1 hypothetical protein [Anaerolineales bacterium]
MKHLRNLSLALSLLLACLPEARTHAQVGGQYFPQTGHNLVGEFWLFYQSIPDAALVFGAPITEQFPARDGSGKILQYFERARLELDPSKPVGERIQITPLGRLLYQPGRPSVNLTVPGACRVFPNGYGVCYDFLAFYDKYGGLERFGNPISAFEFQSDGRITQTFENARFEYYPERGAGNTVRLADLGRIYFNLHEDPALLAPVPPLSAIPRPGEAVVSLKVTAFVWKAVTLPTDTQKVYVIVQDQASKGVEGATGVVVVHFPDGRDATYPFTTNASGIAILSNIEFVKQKAGSLVAVDVQVVYKGLTATTSTSFRIWR